MSSTVDDKRKESIKKNIKWAKGTLRRFCSRQNTVYILSALAFASVIVWIFYSSLFLYGEHRNPVLAVNFHPSMQKVLLESPDSLRGDADQEWLILPSHDDPIEFLSTWDIPDVFKPLEIPSKPMKRLIDDASNYPESSFRRQHGIIGKRPDGIPHAWEGGLQVSLDREYPDLRRQECKNAPYYQDEVVANLPAVSVVFIFSNEPWETLIRSVHSVLNNTPPHLLYEIILVDDGSTFEEYTVDGTQQLIDYIKCCLPPKVKYTRTNTRAGITRARVSGINLAKADIFVILDSHIEAEPGWLEPLVYRIKEDPTNFVMPMIDGIKKDEIFTPAGGGVGCSLGLIWKIMEHALKPEAGVSPDHRILGEPWGYISSPSMSGGLFAGNKQVFLDLGGYDLGMEGWGAENVEFGMRLWQCGAQLHCSECSRVAHIFSRGQFYKQKGGEAVMNRLRTAGVWMDETAVLAWLFNGRPDWSKMGDISDRMQLRKNLQCHNFKWYLENVWPESDIHDIFTDLPYHGPLVNKATKACIKGTRRGQTLRSEQRTTSCSDLVYFSRSKHIGSGKDDESHLTVLAFDWSREHDKQQLYDVDTVQTGDTQDEVRITHVKTGKCLELADDSGYVSLNTCDLSKDTQVWVWTKFSLEGMKYFKPEDF